MRRGASRRSAADAGAAAPFLIVKAPSKRPSWAWTNGGWITNISGRWARSGQLRHQPAASIGRTAHIIGLQRTMASFFCFVGTVEDPGKEMELALGLRTMGQGYTHARFGTGGALVPRANVHHPMHRSGSRDGFGASAHLALVKALCCWSTSAERGLVLRKKARCSRWKSQQRRGVHPPANFAAVAHSVVSLLQHPCFLANALVLVQVGLVRR
jgi:hypothetical protein